VVPVYGLGTGQNRCRFFTQEVPERTPVPEASRDGDCEQSPASVWNAQRSAAALSSKELKRFSDWLERRYWGGHTKGIML
jgi:hypothetical protein